MQKFTRRTPTIEACKHDGTDESATKLEAWINSEGGSAFAHLKGSIDFAQNNAFIRIDGPRRQNLVGPGSWVVKAEEGQFYAISNTDFQILYIPE